MRKKGLVEKLVMQDPAKEDFSSNQFPDNRAKLFLYMIKNKFFKIYKNHWLMALFFVPLIAWGVLTIGYTDSIFSLEPGEGITYFWEHWFTVYVTAIPMWALAFVGLAGGLNVIRKLAWSDPVMLKSDFLQGIKASGKQIALIGFLWGVGYALFGYAFNWLGFYYRAFDDSYSIAFGIFVCLFLLVILIGFTVYMTCMSSLYNVNMKQLFSGAFKLYFADFFLATGVILLSLLPVFVLMLTGYAITLLAAYFLLLVLLIGIIIIPMFLVCQHSFDRIINKKDYPDYYGRGLSYGQYGRSADSTEEKTDTGDISHSAADNEEAENDFERVNDGDN